MLNIIVGFIVGLIVGYLCPGTVAGWVATVKGWFKKAEP